MHEDNLKTVEIGIGEDLHTISLPRMNYNGTTYSATAYTELGVRQGVWRNTLKGIRVMRNGKKVHDPKLVTLLEETLNVWAEGGNLESLILHTQKGLRSNMMKNAMHLSSEEQS